MIKRPRWIFCIEVFVVLVVLMIWFSKVQLEGPTEDIYAIQDRLGYGGAKDKIHVQDKFTKDKSIHITLDPENNRGVKANIPKDYKHLNVALPKSTAAIAQDGPGKTFTDKNSNILR